MVSSVRMLLASATWSAALAADDAALHLVVGQGHHGDGGLGHMVGGAALDGPRDEFPGDGVGLFLVVGLNLLDLHGGLVGDVGLQLGDEVVLGLLGGEAGDALQHFHLGLFDGGDLLPGLFQLAEPPGEGLLFLLDVVGLAVQGLLLLLETALLLLEVGAALLDLFFVLVAGLQDFLLGLHQCLALLALGAFDGLVDDAFCLFLGAADLLFGNVLPVLVTQDKKYNCRNCEADNADNDCRDIHRF